MESFAWISALLEDTGVTGEWIGIFAKSKPLVAAYGEPRSLLPRPASKPAHGGVTECAGSGSREERFDGVRAETRRGAFIGSTFQRRTKEAGPRIDSFDIPLILSPTAMG
jgi:hypothetical protein